MTRRKALLLHTITEHKHRKMERDPTDVIEDNLRILIEVTEKSGNLRKDLKDNITKSVSAIRIAYNGLMEKLAEKDRKIQNLEHKHADETIHPTKPTNAERSRIKPTYAEASRATRTEKTEPKSFKLTVKSKTNHSTEHMKTLIKSKVNPATMKVGIKSFKTLRNGNIQIETPSKSDTELMCKTINEKCGMELEAQPLRRRKPRMIVFNVPDELKIEEAERAVLDQNAELELKKDDLVPRFIFTDRKGNKNMVMEVEPEARKKLLRTKLKIGWIMCNSADYIRITQCFKCCKYNHRAQDCKGELTCPLCSQSHTRQDCKEGKDKYQCINCVTYNKYNRNSTVQTNHSAMDKNCSCYQTALSRQIQITDY